MLETMQTPTTRAEFERRFHLLREQMRQGRFFAPQGISLGIEKVRFLPNGRIDFRSVNELARLQANMMARFQSEAFKPMVNNQGAQSVPKGGALDHTGEAPAE